ncbi:MAG: hypothetical protein Q8P76_03400 [bacterium]|nr:hypothetical protein [bacterium]
MKICFLLQRRFAYIGHRMAVLLKQRYGIDQFCGYASLPSSYLFLKNQKDIHYTGLLLDEEIFDRYKNEKLDIEYIKNFEKQYGIPNLWPYICSDRVVRYGQLVREYPNDVSQYSHEEMLRIFQVVSKSIVEFLDKEKPDCVFISVVGSIASLLLYQVAKQKGIKTLILDNARIGNRYFLNERYDGSTYLDQSFQLFKQNQTSAADENYLKQAADYLKQFQEKPQYYFANSEAYSTFNNKASLRRHFRFLAPSGMYRSLRWLWRQTKELAQSGFKNYYTTIHPWNERWDKLNRKLRILIGYSDLFDPVNLKEDFVYFPLQSEPEAYPMLNAPLFMDQIWTAKQLARSLPAHYKLYVKDHPAMFGYRRRSYYQELKKIPNVRLIDPAVDSLKLIGHSKLVATVSGTAGLEAALLKKPVISFGNVSYNLLSAIKRCENVEDLPILVKNQLDSYHYNEKDIINFLAALFKESVDVDLAKLWDLEGGRIVDRKTNELAPLVDLIAEKLNLNLSK